MKYFTEHALPSGVTYDIPWSALDESRDSYVMSVCLPNGLTTLNPLKMAPHDVYRVYEHIVTSQQSPDGIPFKFTIDEKIHALTRSSTAFVRPQAPGPIITPLPTPATDRPNEQQHKSIGEVSGRKRKDNGDGRHEESDVPAAKKMKSRYALDTL
jgi:hypothetical protein